jgi:3-hydroxyisobutyrate dehydrogenase
MMNRHVQVGEFDEPLLPVSTCAPESEGHMKIGIAGTGRMGEAIGFRLMGLGHELTVWNRTAGKMKALADAGAGVAASPAALAGEVDTIITILTDAKAIDALYHGPQGLLSGNVAGRLFIEMSTVQPEVEVALGAKVKQKDAALVECPVGGTTGPAREGKLFGFAGAADADMARARPILESLCRRLEHVGPIGAGSRMKLAINLPLYVYWQALGEALLLCRPLGLEPERLLSIFADSSGGANVLKVRASKIAAQLTGKDPGPVNMAVELVCKDLKTMIAEANALGGTLPAAETALKCFEEAARSGLAAKDQSVLPANWAKRARG